MYKPTVGARYMLAHWVGWIEVFAAKTIEWADFRRASRGNTPMANGSIGGVFRGAFDADPLTDFKFVNGFHFF